MHKSAVGVGIILGDQREEVFEAIVDFVVGAEQG
jgi:hypothetical protein